MLQLTHNALAVLHLFWFILHIHEKHTGFLLLIGSF